MFWINKYTYVDVNTRSKVAIFSRTVELADKLVDRINKIGIFTLRKARIGFCKRTESEIPPFNVEREQEETIEKWSVSSKLNIHKCS